MSCTHFAFVFFSSLLLWPLTTQADQPRIPGKHVIGQSEVAEIVGSVPLDQTSSVASQDPVASSASTSSSVAAGLPPEPSVGAPATSLVPDTSPQPTSETVTVHVETILATNSEEPVDDRLTDIRHRLGAFRYSSYKLVQEKSQLVRWGKTTSFSLPGGRFLQVLARAYANERIGLELMFLEGDIPTPLMSTTLNIRNRGKLYIGGREHQGGMLILRIGATAE